MEGGAVEIDDYESLPDTLPASTHMIAGATAGITEHCVMYPIDCIKTRMQALNPAKGARYSGVFDAIVTIKRNEGLLRTTRGMNAVIIGAGPAHAMYFACYEKLKWMLSERKQSTVMATIVAGGTATLFHDAIMVPSDVIKQRMQVYNSPYRNSLHCLTSIWRQEGVRALYRSFTTQMAMNIPFQIVHFSVYEQMQNLANYERQYNPVSHMVSGAVAGAAAAFITNPFDVCKTLLNTQEVCCISGEPAAKRGLVEAVNKVYKCQGPADGPRGLSGFFRGVQARMIFQMPAAAISWSVYEFFKYYINRSTSYSTNSSNDSPSDLKKRPVGPQVYAATDSH